MASAARGRPSRRMCFARCPGSECDQLTFRRELLGDEREGNRGVAREVGREPLGDRCGVALLREIEAQHHGARARDRAGRRSGRCLRPGRGRRVDPRRGPSGRASGRWPCARDRRPWRPVSRTRSVPRVRRRDRRVSGGLRRPATKRARLQPAHPRPRRARRRPGARGRRPARPRVAPQRCGRGVRGVRPADPPPVDRPRGCPAPGPGERLLHAPPDLPHGAIRVVAPRTAVAARPSGARWATGYGEVDSRLRWCMEATLRHIPRPAARSGPLVPGVSPGGRPS